MQSACNLHDVTNSPRITGEQKKSTKACGIVPSDCSVPHVLICSFAESPISQGGRRTRSRVCRESTLSFSAQILSYPAAALSDHLRSTLCDASVGRGEGMQFFPRRARLSLLPWKRTGSRPPQRSKGQASGKPAESQRWPGPLRKIPGSRVVRGLGLLQNRSIDRA